MVSSVARATASSECVIDYRSLVTGARASGSGGHGGTRGSPEFLHVSSIAKKVKTEKLTQPIARPLGDEHEVHTAIPTETGDREIASKSGSSQGTWDSAGSIAPSKLANTSSKQVEPKATLKQKSLSVVTRPRDPGSHKKAKLGDSSGLGVVSSKELESSPNQTGGGTTRAQPGEKRSELAMSSATHTTASKRVRIVQKQPIADNRLASSSCRHGGTSEDRLASSSRGRRISSKRPPDAVEGIAAKRQKLDTG